jgi:hypothetical protein
MHLENCTSEDLEGSRNVLLILPPDVWNYIISEFVKAKLEFSHEHPDASAEEHFKAIALLIRYNPDKFISSFEYELCNSGVACLIDAIMFDKVDQSGRTDNENH